MEHENREEGGGLTMDEGLCNDISLISKSASAD